MTAIGELMNAKIGSEVSLRNQAFSGASGIDPRIQQASETVYRTAERFPGWLSPCLRAWFLAKPYSVTAENRPRFSSLLTEGLNISPKPDHLTLLKDDWTGLNSILLGAWTVRCGKG